MNTKQRERSILLLITALLLISSIAVSAKEFAYQKKKEYKQTFRVSQSDLLQAENRFGNITIVHWGKNEVEIRVEVETRGNSEKRAQADQERISVAMEKKGNTISAITSMNDSRWDSENNSNNQIVINYYISMPANLAVNLSQKFGNITLPENNPGRCTLISKFGNIKAGNFTNKLTLECKFGNVELGNIESGVLDISYANSTTTRNAKRLSVDSKYSNIDLGNVDDLNLSNKYGNTKIQSVGKASIETKYGDASIALLKNELHAEIGHGNLMVNEVSVNFKQIIAEARYSNLNLNIPSKAAFCVEAEKMKHGNYNISGFKVTDSSKEGNRSFRTEVNNGGQAIIRFDGNGYSNLKINKL